jgi:hypothetical protein
MILLTKFFALPTRERLAAIETVVLLGIAPCVLRLYGLRRSAAWATRSSAGLAREPWSAARISQLVESIATELPWRTTCLHRALAAASLMRRRGVPGEIAIGVRHDDDGFAAHAWIAGAHDGRSTRGYAPLISWRVRLPDGR